MMLMEILRRKSTRYKIALAGMIILGSLSFFVRDALGLFTWLTRGIIFALFCTELFYFVKALRRQYRQNSQSDDKSRKLDFSMIRPVTFVLFLASFLPATFLPIYVSVLYEPIDGWAQSLVIGVPLAAEACGSALFAVVAGYLRDQMKLQKMFIVGSLMVIFGFIICGYSRDLTLFTIGKFVVGIGMGFLYVATSTMIAEQTDEAAVSNGFSSYFAAYFSAINIGSVAGGEIAMSHGYRTVFFAAAVVAGVAMLITYLILHNRSLAERQQHSEVTQSAISLGVFIRQPAVISLLFFIYLPYLVGTFFLYYFFPLFAAQYGINPARIAQVFLLNGLFVVYIGPIITPYIRGRLGLIGGTAAGTILSIFALACFIAKGTVGYAVLCIALLGIADSFAYTMQTTYYTQLQASQQFGLAKANGIKNTVEHFSYTVAPFIFGTALLAGNIMGIVLIATGLAIGLAVFCVFGNRSRMGKVG